jgi:23S rRNA (adenine2503-C2)-methyltransferase
LISLLVFCLYLFFILHSVVLMGMGEPLANYRNVMEAIRRMNTELGIGARKITISTVGIVPNIKKLMEEDIQVGLAVSLHSANEDDRSLLLPANKRYGGLDTLMETIREYIDTTKRRVTFEWALIEGQNDQQEVAKQLGRLLERHGIRKDMAHINLIPLNPTGGYKGSPSGRKSVEEFVRVLEKDFGLSATPRVRRGIDIEVCRVFYASFSKWTFLL